MPLVRRATRSRCLNICFLGLIGSVMFYCYFSASFPQNNRIAIACMNTFETSYDHKSLSNKFCQYLDDAL
jgi:hypothetical protein